MSLRLILILLAALPLGLSAAPRETDTVRLIRKIEPTVVAIFTQNPESRGGGAGSGVFIHESGFILTCDHVVRNLPGYVLTADGSVLPYRTIGRMPEKDLAVVRVTANKKFPAAPLGRSHDLMTGEPVLCGGNPGGRGIVFSSGIISSTGMVTDAANALVMAHFRTSARDRFIQFDAASNKGNSGGPLFNVAGEVIGVVSQKIMASENINFAVPADRVRKHFLDMVAPEETGDCWLGVETDLFAGRAVVTRVAADSPAARAGLRAGDVLLKAQSRPLQSGPDWVLLATEARPGQPFAVEYEREAMAAKTTLAVAKYPAAKPHAAEGKQAGLKYQLFHTARLTQLPDFTSLTPAKSGVAATLDLATLAGGRDEDFAVVFEGFLRVPASGLHRLVIRSDDGSRLFLNGSLLVDNDRNHPSMDLGRRARLAAGLHPIRLEYFQASIGQELKLLIETPDGKSVEAGAESFLHQ